jgi:thiamine biosynthesis lipoprotein
MRAALIAFFILFQANSEAQQVYKRTLKLMGSRFDITVVANNEAEGNSYIDMAVAEISRIEKLISDWDPNSQVSEITRQAAIKPVKVDKEVFDLIDRSIKISELTSGAFDISYASMDKIWKFDGSMTKKPTEEEIKRSVEKIGYKKIILNEQDNSVFLKEAGMKIGFGAIGKGYAADKAKALLIQKGAQAGIINASGDMNTWGKQPNGESWMVAITNPLNKEKAFSWLPIDNSAIVTSGNYEKFVVFDNIRYAHIIDPRTGYPAQGIVSTSVLCSSAELADALATAVTVMGVEVGLDFINQLKGVECIIVDVNNKVHTSENIVLKPNEK